tara:strand:+ start:490 stop:879 length:390 start_codon:yes stop_codon:yes gene_type:complete
MLLKKAIYANLNPKFIDVIITRRVNDPGKVSVSKASVLADSLEIAGGKKVISGPVTFIRFENNGSLDKRKFLCRNNMKRGSYKNPYLRDEDLNVLGESTLSIATEVINKLNEPFKGIFSTYGLIEAISD